MADRRESSGAAPSGWVPVALVASLDPGPSTGTRLDGREVVVWRDAAGACHVWEDRCPHRGMRLSFGFVRGDRIACLYHGWQFDAAGQCRYIPAHPSLEVPETIRVDRYACVERLGILWASRGTPEDSAIPPRQNLATTAVRSITIGADDAEVLAAVTTEALPAGDKPVGVVRAGALVRLLMGGESLVLAVQNLAPGETCLHVLLVGEEDGDRAACRPRLSAWLEAVRRRAEAAAASRAAAR